MIAGILAAFTGGVSLRCWLSWLVTGFLLIAVLWLGSDLRDERARTEQLATELSDALAHVDVLREAVRMQNDRIIAEAAVAEKAVADAMERVRVVLGKPARKPSSHTAQELNRWLNN